MKKILITGGAGFIGSNFVNTYCKNHELTILDNFSSGKLENIHSLSSVKIIKGDIRNDEVLETLFSTYSFDAVIHLAAISSVHQCQHSPVECLEINYTASIKLIEMAIKHQVKKFIFASSAAIYGDNPDLPKNELTSSPSPISFYGIHKYAVEKTLMIYHKNGLIDGTAFRFFNVFGPQQDPHSPYSGVISIFMNQVLLSPHPEVIIYGNGEQTRDFIHVSDLVRILEGAAHDPQLSGQVFNLGTGKERSLLDMLEALENISGKRIQRIFQEKRAGDIQRSFCDNSKIKELGYEPQVDFSAGLGELYQYLYNEAFNVPVFAS